VCVCLCLCLCVCVFVLMNTTEAQRQCNEALVARRSDAIAVNPVSGV
jgi:hypothetical protein